MKQAFIVKVLMYYLMIIYRALKARNFEINTSLSPSDVGDIMISESTSLLVLVSSGNKTEDEVRALLHERIHKLVGRFDEFCKNL